EHPYSEYINKLKIPVQPNNGDKSPSFLLHNLPEANNEGIINGGYVNKNYMNMLKEKAMSHDNPGPKDLNVAIHEMGREFQKDDPRANTDMALKILPSNIDIGHDDFWVELSKFLEVILKNEEHCTIDDGIERWLHLTKQYIITSLEKKIEKLSHNIDIWETDSLKIIEVGFGELKSIQLNTDILSNNGIVKKAIGIDQCPEVFSYPITIVRPDYKIILCEQGDEDFGLDQFLESPNSTFFVPEDTAGPDLVFIVQFKGPDENYIDVPVFVQAKLSVNIKPAKAIRTTDPNAFYAYQKKENELGYDEPNFTNEPSVNQEKRKKIIEIIDKKFKKARNNGIFWIRILVAYPAKIQQKSYWRSIDNRHTGMHISELMIIIDNDEAKHFFKQEELNILDALKK
ncbi:8050_t:CDS:2, partial [Entrophospora sp. SA101]